MCDNKATAGTEATNIDTRTSQPDLEQPSLYFNRDINWLEFNARVLAESRRQDLPLLEQLNFLTIFANNLDEFFMVRVANILRQFLNNAASTAPDKMTPAAQLDEIRKRSLHLMDIAQDHWINSLSVQLKEQGVHLTRYQNLTKQQQTYLDAYFRQEIFPILTPQAIDPGHPFPMISNISLNFIIQLKSREGIVRFARLKCPNDLLPRLVFVPRNPESTPEHGFTCNVSNRDDDILLLEDLVQHYVGTLFHGHTVTGVGLFRITRNTDVEIEEDEADDLLEAVKGLVEQRRFGNVVRLEISEGTPETLVAFLRKRLNVQPHQIYTVRGPLAFSELQQLYKLDRPDLKGEPFLPHIPRVFKQGDLFSHIKAHDLFLYHPYDSFAPVVDLIQRASRDPRVVAIKQTLYRVGSDSSIVRALIDARRRGKQVTAVVELKARFDEERNITWAEELEKYGAHVVYGLVGMKIHAKLCLVVRREPGGLARYVHIGTGNYNTSSAKIYADMSLFTANPQICADVSEVFNAVTGYGHPDSYRRLLVSPVTMRKGLLACIEAETARQIEHGDGEIILKCNQLVDKYIIQALYRASRAGVKIHLLVRGICCLRPGVPGVSDNITVTAILGRFLEHTRTYWFRNGGQSKMYIGSADMMPRNLDHRVEVVTPILNQDLCRHIRQYILQPQIDDNLQSWKLNSDGSYTRLQPSADGPAISSQVLLMHGDHRFCQTPDHVHDD